MVTKALKWLQRQFDKRSRFRALQSHGNWRLVYGNGERTHWMDYRSVVNLRELFGGHIYHRNQWFGKLKLTYDLQSLRKKIKDTHVNPYLAAAAEVYEIPRDEVTPQQYNKVKGLLIAADYGFVFSDKYNTIKEVLDAWERG